MNVIALLPYMVQNYEDANDLCVRSAENIAQVRTSPKTLALLVRKGHFSTLSQPFFTLFHLFSTLSQPFFNDFTICEYLCLANFLLEK